MELLNIEKIENEEERIIKLYDLLDEKNRLNNSNSSKVEYLTVKKYLTELVNNKGKVLEIGSGKGLYTKILAEMFKEVYAIDLSPNNIRDISANLYKYKNLRLEVGNAKNLVGIADEAFNNVLLMGPLYHIVNRSDRIKAIRESFRVLEKDGLLFMTFMTNDIVPYLLMKKDEEFLNGDKYNKKNFHMNNHLYVFHTIDEIEDICDEIGVKPYKRIALDCLSLIRHNKIDKLSDELFKNFMEFHFYLCEKREFLGASSHVMYVLKKV